MTILVVLKYRILTLSFQLQINFVVESIIATILTLVLVILKRDWIKRRS